MDCKDARRLAEYARPGVAELDAADLAGLEQHLAACPDCGAMHRAERRRDERFARAFQDVALPAGMQTRLLSRLRAARFAWWRTRILLASVAIVGITLGLSVGSTYYGRPVFDPLNVALATYEQAGQWRSADEARTIVNQWLRGVDARLTAPAEWNYRYVAFLGRSDFEGLTSVPTMVLTRGEASARIYVVRATAFRNLDAYDQPIEEGGCTVAVRRYADLPGWAFIVVTGGGSIDLFLRPSAPRDPA